MFALSITSSFLSGSSHTINPDFAFMVKPLPLGEISLHLQVSFQAQYNLKKSSVEFILHESDNIFESVRENQLCYIWKFGVTRYRHPQDNVQSSYINS